MRALLLVECVRLKEAIYGDNYGESQKATGYV